MFAGLISKEQPVSSWGDPDKILAALAPYSLDKPRNVWTCERQMLLQVATRNDAETAEIFRHPESGVAVAFWGRLDNRPDLIAQLAVDPKASDDELIALAWLNWGEFCPEKLIGDFAFAVASPLTGVVFLARDVMGVKPLFYRTDQHGVFFANTAAAFKPLQLGSLTRSQKWMAEYMLGLSNSHTETAYEEIKKLQGAHCLLIYADGRMNMRRYHQFIDDAPVEKKRDPKYLEAYRAAWQEAVACRMPTSGNFGTENSGGLDSGSITAELARQLGSEKDRLFGFGYCLEPLEPQYIMTTAMKFGLSNQFMICDPAENDYKNMQEREILVSGYPQEHENAAWYRPFYEQCKIHDIGVLFSGFGGDEVVTSEFGISHDLVSHGDYGNLYKTLPGGFPSKLKHMMSLLIRRRKAPENNVYALSDYMERWQYYFLKDETINQYRLHERYLGLAKFLVPTRRINDAALVHLNQPYISTRLDNCTLTASAYGIDYVWPMWDQRLMQQWLSTPFIWKRGNNGLNRFLHRQAVKGTCPDLVTWKPDKDMGYQHTRERLSSIDLRQFLDELINAIDSLMVELESLVDKQKALSVVQKVRSKQRSDVEQYFAVKYAIEFLSDLSNWLKLEGKHEL